MANKYIGIITRWLSLVLLYIICGGQVLWGQSRASDRVILRPRSMQEILSLRSRVPKLEYTLPDSRGFLDAGPGSTIVIEGNRSILAIRPEGAGSSDRQRHSLQRDGGVRDLELKVVRGVVYFSRELERFEVIELTGRAVIVKTRTQYCDLQSLSSGVYIIRCFSQGSQVVAKVIIR